jgi:chromate transporter
MHILLKLFLVFFKVGLFTIGGGYAMIPLIQKEVVELNAWITPEEFIDVVAIAEMTPGPIAVNAATFIGFKMAGIPGAVVGTLGVILPSLIIIMIIASFFLHINEHPKVQAAFRALRPAVVGLIVAAVFTMGKKGVVDIKSGVIAAAAFAVVYFLNIHPIFMLIGAGVLGALIF